MNDAPGFLIWRSSIRGPTVMKTIAIPTNGSGQPTMETLKTVKLTPEEMNFPLRVLERMYPLEG